MNDRKPTNDHRRVHDWPDMHWNIAGFVCACIPVLAALLVSHNVLNVIAASCAAVIAIAYVLLLTWYLSRGPKKPNIKFTE